MKSILRVFIMIAVLFGIVGLARNQVAWAATSSETADQSTLGQVEESVSPAKDDDCDEPENKDRPRCQDKHKDKDKCKKNPKHCGSVKPPPHKITIRASGDYSVGGFCTLSTAWTDPDILLYASIVSPLPRELPDKVQKVRQGCLLEYYSSDERIDEMPTASGNTTICFAATPGKQITIYFDNKYSADPEWVALDTTTNAGQACATANASGVYAATFQKP